MIESERKTFKILTIDGGGIKGLYPATILEHFEDKFDCHISDHFDLICGTSTGGLIALALSLKIPAKTISDFYINKGELIFPHRPGLNTLKQILWGGKFTDKQLKIALAEIFKDKKLGESNNLLCIPTYSLTDGKPWVFKFDHKEYELSRDNKALYVDVALATSAAPTYFPLCEIDYLDSKQFIDGGVWANNPTLVGLIEALSYFVGKGKEYDDIKLMSISCLTLSGGKEIGLNRHRSFVKWKSNLFDTINSGQSFFTNYFMEKITELNDVKIDYLRVPSVVISSEQEKHVQMDNARKKAIKFIRGKGNDQGEIFKKDLRVKEFFKTTKTYNTNY